MEALKAAASRQGLALAKQRAAVAQAEARIAELTEAAAELGGRYASAQVSARCSVLGTLAQRLPRPGMRGRARR